MAVATGTATHTTKFTVPITVKPGAYSLTVVANGIPSKPVAVSASIFVFPVEWEAMWQWLTLETAVEAQRG